jgi:hypothetical protein
LSIYLLDTTLASALSNQADALSSVRTAKPEFAVRFRYLRLHNGESDGAGLGSSITSTSTARFVPYLGERKRIKIGSVAETGLETDKLDFEEGLQKVDEQPVCRTWLLCPEPAWKIPL